MAMGATLQNTSYEYNREGALVIHDQIIENWSGTPWHFHPRQSEQFEVHEGVLWIETREEWLQIAKGESYMVPSGKPHRIHTIGSGAVKVTITLDPAYDTELFFHGMASCFRQNKTPILQVALMHKNVDHLGFYYDRIPVWLQETLFTMLAPLARLLHYRMPEGTGMTDHES